MPNFNALADQVLSIDRSKSREEILIDLEYTKSAENTINRIFEGEFLRGTSRDSSARNPKADFEEAAFVVLDSDEEQEQFEDLLGDVLPSLPNDLSSAKKDSNDFDEIPALPAEKALSSIATNTDILEISSSLSKHSNDLFDQDDLASSSQNECSSKSFSRHAGALFLDNVGSHQQDNFDSLPSATDFFGQLMSQKRVVPVVEIDDDGDSDGDNSKNDFLPEVAFDRKGKRKAADDIMSIKEKKRLAIEERKQQRTEAAEAKKRLKEQMAIEKQKLKEQKQLEKEKTALLEKENRLRLDRTQILQEMIIDIHPDFLQSKSGQLLEVLLKSKEASIKDLTAHETLPDYTIGWRRRCQSEWNHASQAFLPLNQVRIIREPVVLIYLDILTLINHIQADTLNDLVTTLEQPGRQTIMLIEGLEGYYKKKMIMTRREFASQVLQTTTQTRKKSSTLNHAIAEGPCKEEVEEVLNYLQLMRDIMLVPTKDAQDTASWIESLTIDLALGRYKSKNLNNSFKVSKCGHDAHDTFYKMLQEVQLCTPAIATSIMSYYPTLQSLHRAYRSKPSTSEAELMLADLEVERSALQVRDRKINRVMSRKMYTIFNSQDPEQIIY